MGMRSVRDLLDQPVISGDDVYLGEVADAYLEPTEQRVVKLSVDWARQRDQVTGPDMDLPLAQVSNFDPHQLVVASEIGETSGLEFDPYEEQELVPISRILDREVVTREGSLLGLLADIFFDDADGAVTGYEVEQPGTGLPSRILAPALDLDFSGDRMLVPDRFHLVDERAFPAEEDEPAAEEQDLVFESGEHDRKTDDPTMESLEEIRERTSFLD